MKTAIVVATNCLTFNIETIPDPDMPEEVLPQGPTTADLDNLSAPSNYKDEVKIAEYLKNARAKAIVEGEKKALEDLKEMAILPVASKIICLSTKWEDSPTQTIFGDDEESILEFLTAQILEHKPRKFISFNGKSFDVPHLMIKAVQHEIYIPFGAMLKRFSTNPHLDVYEILSFYGAHRKGNLTAWAQRMGVVQPVGKGFMVHEWWQKGEWENIKAHCASNVESTYALACRTESVFPVW